MQNAKLGATAAISTTLDSKLFVEKRPTTRGRVSTDVKTPSLTSVTGVLFDWMLGVLRDFILCAAEAARRFPELDVARLQPQLAVCPHMRRSPCRTFIRREVSL